MHVTKDKVKNYKPILKTVFKLLFSGLLIYWVFSNDKFKFSEFKAIFNLKFFSISLIMILASTFVTSERWRCLLKSQNFKNGPFEIMKLTLIGIFFNFLVPGGVGGDVAKAWYVIKENPQAKTKSVATIVMDRLLGLFSMVMISIVVMLFNFQIVTQTNELKLIFLVLTGIFIGFMILWTLIFSRRFIDLGWAEKIIKFLPMSQKLNSIYQTFTLYRETKNVFYASLFYSSLSQIIVISFFIWVGQTMGFTDLPIFNYFFIIPVGLIVTALPISPGGVGVGQATFFFLFNLVMGETTSLGPIAFTSLQGIQLILGLIGAGFYITQGRRFSSKTELSV